MSFVFFIVNVLRCLVLCLRSRSAFFIAVLFVGGSYASTQDNFLNGREIEPEMSDAGGKSFPIGFEFLMQGKTYTKFYADFYDNSISLEQPGLYYLRADWSAGCLPLKASIYAYGTRSAQPNYFGQIVPGSTIKYLTIGEAPSRRLVVQWTNKYYFQSKDPTESLAGTYQVVLYEGTNEIKIQYLDIQRPLRDDGYPDHAVMGVRGRDGVYSGVGCNEDFNLSSGSAV